MFWQTAHTNSDKELSFTFTFLCIIYTHTHSTLCIICVLGISTATIGMLSCQQYVIVNSCITVCVLLFFRGKRHRKIFSDADGFFSDARTMWFLINLISIIIIIKTLSSYIVLSVNIYNSWFAWFWCFLWIFHLLVWIREDSFAFNNFHTLIFIVKAWKLTKIVARQKFWVVRLVHLIRRLRGLRLGNEIT